MHPALSVILFTVTSGIGYAMLAVMGVMVPLGLFSPSPWVSGIILTVGFSLVSVGLLSSTFHLRHPERACRALTQWRSSWLSREGIAAIATYVPGFLFGYGLVVLDKQSGLWGLWGFMTTAFAAATIFSTSMIYASLKSIPHWHHRLVPPVYLTLGFAGGGLWLIAITAIFDKTPGPLPAMILAVVILGAVLKILYWRSIDTQLPESNSGTATGLGAIGTVRQLAPPRSSGNWVMREMGFIIARKHGHKLRRIVSLLAFILPLIGLILLILGIGPEVFIALLITVSMTLGTAIERWLFFAEAKHVVRHFYD